jgi:glycosyltransferase involved in cell wall biosynthesis
MRIGQVAPLYEPVPPPYYGGTERVVSYLTEELVRRGNEVTLFASGDSITKARLIAGCPQALRLDSSVDPLARHFVMLEQVFKRADDFDLLHFHIDYLHFPLSRRKALTQVTTLHGRLDLPDLRPLYCEFQDMPLISISEAQRKPLAFAHWQGTVYHGLPEDLFTFRAHPADYLVFLGRIAPEKGVDRAIEIAKRSGRTLKIAAKVDRMDREYFNTLIKPMLDHPLIEYLGEIGHEEKNELLGGACGLVFPIDWPEPFGLVMIEAFACGTPVLAFRRGSVPEIITNGVTGFVVKDVAEAVKSLDKLAGLNRARCRQEFEARFTARRMADDYMCFYESLASPKAQSKISRDYGRLKGKNQAAGFCDKSRQRGT